MGAGKPSTESFSFDTSEDEDAGEPADATTIDDSYLAHLSERLANEDREAPASRPPKTPLPTPVPRPSAIPGPGPTARPDAKADPIAATAAAGSAQQEVSPFASPDQVESSSDVMELSQDSLMPADGQDSASVGAPQPSPEAEGGHGPSDLLAAVPPPPPPAEEEANPLLNPATYDAPTFVRPSLIEQDPVPVMEIIEGNEGGRSYRLEKEITNIGRGLENDIVLTDIAVSRRHARLIRQGNFVSVEDLGSGNGTLINGVRVQRVPVSGTDRVEIGNTIFRLLFPGEHAMPVAVGHAPPPAPALSVLHQKSTAHMADQQELVQAGVIPAVAPSRGSTTAAEPRPRQPSVPLGFKVAMGALIVFVLIVGIVGIVALLMNSRVLQQQGAGQGSQPQPTAADLFAAGTEAYAQERWSQAADAFERVLALTPEDQRARAYLGQARSEESALGTLELAKRAVDEQNYEDAVATLKIIPQSSVYYSKASDLRRRAQQAHAAALVSEARRLTAEGEQEVARARLEQAVSLDPANTEARTLLQQLGPGAPGTQGTNQAVAALTNTGSMQLPTGPGEQGRPPTHSPNTNRGKQPPRNATSQSGKQSGSSQVADILAMYKRGQFADAMGRARELSASCPTEDVCQQARSLAGKIDRFSTVWRTAQQSGGNLRQELDALENAMKLDAQISGGHFAPQIRPKLRDAYMNNAQRAWRAGQYASACQSAQRALAIDRTATAAASIAGNCETKAREFYEVGLSKQDSDLNEAKIYWRKVLSMVPRDSQWYGKAYSSLNNAGRRGYVDEDE